MSRIPTFASPTSHAPGRVSVQPDIRTSPAPSQGLIEVGRSVQQFGQGGERLAAAMRRANEVRQAADIELAFLDADEKARNAALAGDLATADKTYTEAMRGFAESLGDLPRGDFRDQIAGQYAIRAKKSEIGVRRAAASKAASDVKDSITIVGEVLRQRVIADGDLFGALDKLERQSEMASEVIGADAIGPTNLIARDLIETQYNTLLEDDPARAKALMDEDAVKKYLPGDEITARKAKAADREKDFAKEAGRHAFDGVSKAVNSLMTGDPTKITPTNVHDLVEPAVGELSKMMGVSEGEVRTKLLGGWLDAAIKTEDTAMFDAAAQNMPKSSEVVSKRAVLEKSISEKKQRENDAERLIRVLHGSNELMPQSPEARNEAYKRLREDQFGLPYIAGLFAKSNAPMPSDLLKDLEQTVRGDDPDLRTFVDTVDHVYDNNKNLGTNLSRKFGDVGRVAWDVTRGVTDQIADQRLEALQHPDAWRAMSIARDSLDKAKMEEAGERKGYTSIPDLVRNVFGAPEASVPSSASSSATSHFMFGVAKAMGVDGTSEFLQARGVGHVYAAQAMRDRYTLIESVNPMTGRTTASIVESAKAGIPPENEIDERQRRNFSLQINAASEASGLTARPDLAFMLDGERHIPMMRAGRPMGYMVWNDRSGKSSMVSDAAGVKKATDAFDAMGYTISDVHPFRDLLWQKDYGDVSAEDYDRNVALRIIDIARARWRDSHMNTDPEPSDEQFLRLVDSVGRALNWNKVFSDNATADAKTNP